MPRPKDASAVLVPAAVAALALVCCAALPVLAGGLAGVALGTVIGVGGGLVALIAALSATVMVLRARRRRSIAPTSRRPAR
jgi:hypothetical protein